MHATAPDKRGRSTVKNTGISGASDESSREWDGGIIERLREPGQSALRAGSEIALDGFRSVG